MSEPYNALTMGLSVLRSVQELEAIGSQGTTFSKHLAEKLRSYAHVQLVLPYHEFPYERFAAAVNSSTQRTITTQRQLLQELNQIASVLEKTVQGQYTDTHKILPVLGEFGSSLIASTLQTGCY